ncbi:thioredoxin domain-containing protein [Candidatus Woesearchaeota archaeon]|nr:thioredoxin domain-containing protein [Candidatus Woesearchaeota archaeon]
MAKKHTGHKTKKTKHASHAHEAAKHDHHKHHESHKGPKHEVKKAPAGANDSIKNAAIVVLSLALIAVLVWAFTNGDVPEPTKGTTGDTVAVSGVQVDAETLEAMKELADDDPVMGAEDAPITIVEFSDFECPYCTRFWEQTLPKIKEEFVDTGLVKLVYRDLPLSFHDNAQKAAEAAECAHDQDEFWAYHDKLFASQDGLSTDSLKKYATDLGLDVEEFNECLDSGKHAQEVQADAEAARQQGITGTPGFVINGQTISGAQPFDKFQQIVCGIAPDSEPCADIEPPKEFTVTIVNDEDCTGCDTGQVESVTKNLFAGATFETVDASSQEGQALIEKHGLTYAPAYLFPDDVEETSSWQNQPDLKRSFIETSDGYRLNPQAVGATWYFSEEKRLEEQAKTQEALGLETGDNKPQVDFFVMSYCPYGNQAEELLKPVYDKLKGEAEFNPRYVIYNQGSGCYEADDGTQLCSLHGEVELNQNVRELCVLDEYGTGKWFDFALAMNDECTSSNADTCWTDVAEAQGIDTDKVESCFEENKVAYAKEDYELGQMLGVSGSPTLFFEGEKYDGARSSNGYLSALCSGFDDAPAACDDALEEAPQATAPQGSC